MKAQLERYLGWCARRAVLREKPHVKAVVGSVGKTSTKEALGIVLGAHVPGSGVRVSAKNYNNELGVPLTILDRMAPGRSLFAWIELLVHGALVGFGLQKIGASTLVLEMGTDHPGDLKQLMKIVKPDLVVVTAIGAEHTEFFGSIDGVALEELSALEVLDADGMAILNADDPRVMLGKEQTKATVVTFGESQTADVRLVEAKIVVDEINPEDSGLDVHIVSLGHAARFRLHGVFGKPQAFAVTAALASTVALDIDFHEAIERLQDFQGAPGRTRLIEGIKHTMLLDDSYNSSPLAALSAVQDLVAYPLPAGGRRIAAIGDMLELGVLADESHRALGEVIARAGIDMLVACGTLAHVAADAATQAGMPEDRVFTFAKSPEAGLFIQDRLKPGDAVLIKGSQGARMEKITRELMAEPLRAPELLVRQSADWT